MITQFVATMWYPQQPAVRPERLIECSESTAKQERWERLQMVSISAWQLDPTNCSDDIMKATFPNVQEPTVSQQQQQNILSETND
jgi:hypothetical protein